jgi:hypothetical protein
VTQTGESLLGRLLGAAEGRTVGAMALRELSLIVRSRDWGRYLMMWGGFCAALIIIPLLIRSQGARWLYPTGSDWFVGCGYVLQIGLGLFMVQWTVHRMRRDLVTTRLDELMLTRCSPADIAMGEALASAVASLWLVAVALPVCIFLSAMAGLGLDAAARLALSLAPTGGLGVFFGMGWGLAFTLRRPGAALSPLTDWWAKGPIVGPVWVGWAVLMFFTLAWAVLGPLPGGSQFLGRITGLLGVAAQFLFWHFNPLLTVGAAAGAWPSTWITDWLVALGITLFMMRKSMDSVQLAIGVLPDRDIRRDDQVYWFHHDVRYFMQFGESKRREPQYRDSGDPIAEFDIALGHRVFLHPFLWALALMAYLFLVGWSMLIPPLALGTSIVAVLIPATAALLLISGGVAVSFGWERDQHRWPSLASLPITNYRLAAGKIQGVVRPTLWLALLASFTAVAMGWRGVIEWESALWMALHVLCFPVALAFITAALALTTPTLGEALYRWTIFGATPTLAWMLPPPIGGDGGLALPFSPPLVALLLAAEGPSTELIRASWISLGLEGAGVLGALVIFQLWLRAWTVGERD